MSIFEQGPFEQVVFCHDESAGLRAIIAIHSTRLGPALGGTRFYPYANEDDALRDALRLAKGMTHKAAAAGLDLGGGKAVIIGDPKGPAGEHGEALLRAYARHVEALGGRYVTAEDVGTSTADMDMIRRDTSHVVGVSPELGGSGDPSPATAMGVLHAMRAVSEQLWGARELAGRHVIISGVGKVGAALARLLVAADAKVTLSNRTASVAHQLAEELGADVVAHDRAHAEPCDIWSPSALGSVLTPDTIPELRCRAVVGCANNQLADASCADRMTVAGVLYAPDFIVNAGGLINVADELQGYRSERAYHSIARIGETTARVLKMAAAAGITTLESADRIVAARLAGISSLALPRTRLS